VDAALRGLEAAAVAAGTYGEDLAQDRHRLEELPQPELARDAAEQLARREVVASGVGVVCPPC
jgi:hypothetical protein